MHLPIQYALTFPERRASAANPVDLLATGRLEFFPPDESRFPALRVAREAGRLGPRASTALIAADEVAVARFLAGTLDFPGIARALEAAVDRFGHPTAGESPAPDLDEVIALDAEVRAVVAEMQFGATH
jgi:1-deoxy-D-xylulose-5-phosphate reductoisomerase